MSFSKEGGPTRHYMHVRKNVDEMQSIYNMDAMRHILESNNSFTQSYYMPIDDIFLFADKFSYKYPYSCISYYSPGFLMINTEQFNVQCPIGIE